MRTLPQGLEHRPDTGQWVVRTQALADIALRDPHIGMSLDPDRRGVALPGPDEVPSVAQFFELWYQRGANHPAFSKALRGAYSAAAIAPFTPVFERIAGGLGAALPAEGDLVESFISPYCLGSTFALMGFPEAEWPRLGKAYHVIMFVIRQRFRGVLELPRRQQDAFTATMRYLRAAVLAAQAAPEPTPLVRAFTDYAATAQDSVWADVATIGQLLAAGVPQVNTGVGVSIRALFADGLLERVRGGEVTVEQVAEEAMRLAPPFLVVAGWTTQTCDCLGVRLPPRTPVLVDIAAVNTDPEHVERPTEFCPVRGRGANITFGKGAHYCLGATSARAQVAAALTALAGTGPLGIGPVAMDDDGFSQVLRAMPYRR
ncbi:cytochrome P450 [Actinokineospora sp. 24-640]